MRKYLIWTVLLLAAPAMAQTGALQGFANRGAWPATVSGLNSSNNFQNVIPSATITVYLTGTTTLATLFSDKNNTPLDNPFTADASGSLTPGHWIFWASDTQAYDIVASGGISPNTYPSPVTLCTDCYPSNQFTVAAGVNSAEGTTPIAVNGAFSTPEQGDIDISCPGCDSLGVFSNAPLTGQYVIVYPVSVTPSFCGTSNTASGDDKSGQVVMVGAGSCGNSSVTWGFNVSALPAGVPIGNVTAVYPFVVSASSILNTNGSGNSFLTSCSGTGVTLSNNHGDLGNNTNVNYPSQQYTSSTSLTVSTGNFNAMTCSIVASMVDPPVGDPRTISGSATLVGAYVYYTGSPVSQPSQVYVRQPLNFDSSTSTLSLPLPYDASVDVGTADNYITTNSAFTQAVGGLKVTFCAVNTNATTTPNLNLNGWGATTIVGPTGGALRAGDISDCPTTGVETQVILGANGEWFLQNPQVSGGGSSVSITSSLGSLTFTPSPLTGTGTADINYAHAGTWTALETFSAGISIPSGQGVTQTTGGSTTNCWNTNGSTTACGASGVLPSGVKGQTPTNDGTGATTYTAQSPTIGVANGGASITTAYQLLCDSATVSTGIQDRGKWAIVGTSGSVVLPDLAGTGCGGMFGGVLNSTTGSVTVSRQTSDTLNCYVPGSAPSTGQTSCTVPEGSWALFSPAISATAYDVKIMGAGGTTGAYLPLAGGWVTNTQGPIGTSGGTLGVGFTDSAYNFQFSNGWTGNFGEGIAYDGTYIYGTSISPVGIYKYNSSHTLVDSNTTPFAGITPSVSHIGDVEIYSNKMYAPLENYSGCGTTTQETLGVYDMSTTGMPLLTFNNIAADGHEASSVAVDGANNKLYVGSFCDGSQLWIYNMTTLTLESSFTLSYNITGLQGLSFNPSNGMLYAWGNDFIIYSINPVNGAVTPVYVSPEPGEIEGLDFTHSATPYADSAQVMPLTPINIPWEAIVPSEIALQAESTEAENFAPRGRLLYDTNQWGMAENMFLTPGSTTAWNYDKGSSPAIMARTNIASSDYEIDACPANLSLPFAISSCKIFSFNTTGDFSNSNGIVIPHTVTGTNGNASGVKIPLATAWSTPSAVASVCHDTNGNIVDSGCPGLANGAIALAPDNQTGTAYTLALADAAPGQGYVSMNNASANTVTIPPNSSVAFPVGTIINAVQLGAGQTCFVAGAGVTIHTPISLCAHAQYSQITVWQQAANTWIMRGDMGQGPPSFSLPGGTYAGTQSLTITPSITGATVCYTTDGSAPTGNNAGTCTHGSTYSGPVSVSVSETVKAIGSVAGYTDSSVASAAYTIQPFAFLTGCSAHGATSCAFTATTGSTSIGMCVGGAGTLLLSSAGTTWTPLTQTMDTITSYTTSLGSSGSTTFTCANSSNPGMDVLEYAAQAPSVFVSSVQGTASGVTYTSPSFNAPANSLVVLCAHASGGGPTITAGVIGGVTATMRENTSAQTPGTGCEDVQFSTSQTGITATMTSSSGSSSWGGTVVVMSF